MDTKCLNCGTIYEKRTTWQKFCSADCRNEWHNLQKKVKPIVLIEKIGDKKNLSNGEKKA